MLVLYVNGYFIQAFDTPREVILAGIRVETELPDRTAVIGNDFGDRWPLREYIDKIEQFTAIRIPEKEQLNG